MSTYSQNLGLTLISSGSENGTWGTTTNTNLGTLLEQAVSGYVDYACTGGVDTITIPNGATGVARNMFLELTGSGGGTLIVPSNKKLYFIYNNTNSGVVTVKVSGQTGVGVPNGQKMLLVSNGTDIVPAVTYIPTGAVNIGGFSITESGGVLQFKYGSTVLMTLSSTGDLAVIGNADVGADINAVGNVTAYFGS